MVRTREICPKRTGLLATNYFPRHAALVTHVPASFALDPEACVTASDLVRQFGAWQERAIRHPVFVMRRGRPSLVLTSIDLMRQLCAAHRTDASSLLDAMEESVLTIDAAGVVQTANRAAIRRFSTGGSDVEGAALSELMADPVAHFILERAADLHPGDTEQMDVEIHDRPFRITLTQSDEGTILIASDMTNDTRCRVMTSIRAAFSASAEAMGVATARLDRRGHICEANVVLARMMDIAPSTLAGMEFGQLSPPIYRPLVDEAVSRAVTDGGTHRIDLEIGHGGHVATQVALTGIRVRSTIEGVAVVIRPSS